MRLVQIDAMVDFAIARISERRDGYRTVVHDLVIGWPDATGLQVVFVLVSSVSAIERVFPKGHRGQGDTDNALRMAALLGTDLFALEEMGLKRPNGHDLLEYWEKTDPFFLNL